MKQVGRLISGAYIPKELTLLAAYAPTDQRLATEAYCLGTAITLPYARFSGKIMYHCDPFKGGLATPDCDNRDRQHNHCAGHDMSRADFINEHCGGVEPRRLV